MFLAEISILRTQGASILFEMEYSFADLQKCTPYNNNNNIYKDFACAIINPNKVIQGRKELIWQ